MSNDSQQMDPSIFNRCFQGCTLDQPVCSRGDELSLRLKDILKATIDPTFYGLSARIRNTFWLGWNVTANQYLEHVHFCAPPIDYAQEDHHQVQQQCRLCEQMTPWMYLVWGGRTKLTCLRCYEQRWHTAAVLLQKLRWIDWVDNPFAITIFTQVCGWIEREGLLESQLDERFEEWKSGFSCERPEWMAYTQLYGAFNSDRAVPYQTRHQSFGGPSS